MKTPPDTIDHAVQADLAPDAISSQPDTSPMAVAMRLNQAIAAAGGRDQVALKSGLAKRTLSRALNGEPVRRGTLLDIASSLNLPPNWLLEGRGKFNPEWVSPTPIGPQPDGTEVVAGPVMPLESPENKDKSARGLFGTVDLSRLATALEGAQKAFHDRGITPSSHRLVQVMLLLYDEATQQATNPSES